MEHTDLLKQVGISVVTTILAVWGLSKYVGKSWVDTYFHHRKQEIETDFKLLVDRTSKLYQIEFTVLPELWRKMSLALYAIVELTADRIYPTTRTMDEGELSTFLETSPLLDWEKGEIKDHRKNKPEEWEERDRKLANMLDWAGYRKSDALTKDLRSYLMTQSIFVSESLRRKLDDYTKKMTAAVSEYQRFLEYRQTGQGTGSLELCRHVQGNWNEWAGDVQAELQLNLRANEKTQTKRSNGIMSWLKWTGTPRSYRHHGAGDTPA